MPDRIDPAAVLGIDPTDRSFAAYLTAQERDQLDARAATAEQERDDALDERDEAARICGEAGIEIDRLRADRDAYKEARDVLRVQLDQVQQRNRDLTNLLRQKRDTISALAAELGDAHDLIAEIRNNRANDDRAFARWETRQTGLGSLPPRAQDEPGRRSETGCMGDPDTELRLAGVHPDQEAARAAAAASDAARRHALAFNAITRALAERRHFIPLSMRERCAEAVLAALDADRTEREG